MGAEYYTVGDAIRSVPRERRAIFGEIPLVLRLVVPDKWVERIDQLAVDQGKTQLEVISELISETVNDMPQAIPDKQIRVRKPKILRVMVPEKLGKRITRLAEAKEMSSSEFIFDVLTIAMKPQSKAT